MAHTYTFDVASPPDSEDARLGALRIRQFKSAILEREILGGRSYDLDDEDGKFKFALLRQQTVKPTVSSTDSAIYTKATGPSNATQLFYEDKDGTEFNLIIPTFGTPIGVIQAYGAATAPSGWLLCDGSDVSQTTYSDLYGIIGTTYGAPGGGDFTLPDLQGKFIAGYSGAGDYTLANTFGADSITLTESEIPSLGNHSVSGPRGSLEGGPSFSPVETPGAGHSWTEDASSFDNRPASVVCNYIIFAGPQAA